MQRNDQRGFLKVPAHAEIIRAEPAIKYKKRSGGCFLYQSQPVYSKNAIKQIDIPNQEVADSVAALQLTEIKLKDGLVDNGMFVQKLSENAKILARPFEYRDPKNPSKKILHPELMEVFLYKEKSSEEQDRLPEGDQGVEILQKGFMYKSDLIPEEKFKPYNQNIFRFTPNANQIRQEGMGDCYLLSPISSALAIGARAPHPHEVQEPSVQKVAREESEPGVHFFQHMMVQLADGTVIVRLFHPVTGEPVYVRVENSYLTDASGKSLVEHLAPWIHILEKAYAVLGYKLKLKKSKNSKGNKEEEYEIVPGSFLTVYGSGGRAHLATKILTGQHAEFFPIDNPHQKYQPSQNAFDHAAPLAGISKLIDDSIFGAADPSIKNELLQLAREENYKEIEKRITQLADQLDNPKDSWLNYIPELGKAKIYHVVQFNKELLRRWGIYLYIYTSIYNKELPIDVVEEKTQTNLFQYIEKFEQLSPSPPHDIIAVFKQYVTQHKEEDGRTIYEFPADLLQGKYSREEIDIFVRLENDIKENKILTAHANKQFKNKDNKIVAVDGLNSSHDYAIVDIQKEKIGSPKDSDQKDVYFVKLRNPWGTTGRFYDVSTGQVIPVEFSINGEFKLDLHDFVKYFKGYSSGSIPSPEALEQLVQQAEVTSSEQINAFLNTQFSYPRGYLSQLEIIQTLSTSEIVLRHKFLQSQSQQSLYQLIRFLENEVFDIEHQLLQHPIGAHPAVAVIESLSQIQQYNKLLAQARGAITTQFANALREAKTKNEPEPNIIQFFQERDLAMVRNEILNKSFATSGQEDGDQTDQSQIKAEFVFELEKLPVSNIDRVLETQTLNDLYQLMGYLKKSIADDKAYASQLKKPELKQIAEDHLKTKTRLFAIVNAQFVKVMKQDVSVAIYKLNAQNYQKEKNAQKSLFYRFTRSVKTFFSFPSDADNYRRIYKRHLKEEQKFPVTEEIAQLAFDYLNGAGQSANVPASQQRMATILINQFKRKLTSSSMAKLTKEGSKLIITYDSLDETQPKIFVLDATTIRRLARAQKSYIDRMLDEMKLENKNVDVRYVSMQDVGLFAQQRKQNLAAIASSPVSFLGWAAQGIEYDEKIKSRVAAKAEIRSDDIERVVVGRSGNSFTITLELFDNSKKTLGANSNTIEAFAIHGYNIAQSRQPAAHVDSPRPL